MHRMRIPFVLLLLAATAAVAQPPGCATQGVTIYSESFENGTGGYTQFGTNGVWTLTAARAFDGTVAVFAPNQDSVTRESLFSSLIDVPPGKTVLRFHQWQEIEANDPVGNPPHSCYDGAVIEISTMGGGDTYQRLDAEITSAVYDGTIHTDVQNPLAGERAWCGDPRDWHEVVVDLTPYAGNAIHLKWILATDSSVGREGWYIDNIRIEQCDSFSDGFESGDTSAWAITVP